MKEILQHGSGADLEHLINPILQRIRTHHDSENGYKEVIKVLNDAKVTILNECKPPSYTSSSSSQVLLEAQRLKMTKVDGLIAKVRSESREKTSLGRQADPTRQQKSKKGCLLM